MSGAAIVITSIEGWLITPPLVPMLVVIKTIADRVDRLRPLGRLMAP